MTAQELKGFFHEIDDRKDSVKALNTEIKEAFEAIASSHNANVKALKKLYRLHVDITKDNHAAKATEFEYQAMSDLLIPAN